MTENMQVSGMVGGGNSGTAFAIGAARKTHVFNVAGVLDERCPVVLVVDEGQALLADPVIVAAAADLIRLGRQADAQTSVMEGDRR